MKTLKVTCFWFPFACFLLPFSAQSQTYISNDVSGDWIKSLSPYIVTGNIRLRNGESLQIESGVVVKFDGPYEFNVEGLLQADGTLEDTITFTSNLPDSTWGGIRFSSAHDSGRLVYCKIEHGSASDGGGIWVDETRLRIAHCLFQKNRAEEQGGGLYAYNSHVTITNSRFLENSADGTQYSGGGGLYSNRGYMLGDENILLISNSEFCNNYTSGEGGAIETGRGTYSIHGTQFINNNADIEGGAIFGYDFLIINCTFFNNTSPSASTLRCGYSDHSIILNSIIYDFTESSSTVELPYSDLLIMSSIMHNVNFNEGNLTIEYSNIDGGWPGEGNIDQDPGFFNPAYGDFHLQNGSPCTNAGNPHVLYNDWNGTRNDMGIYGGSDLLIEPLEIDFGPQGIGQTKTESIILYNFRNSSLTLQSALPDDENNFSTATAFPKSIPAATFDTVNVRFHPITVGDIYSQLVINSTDLKGTSELEIDLRGLGGYWSGPVSGIWRAANSPYIIGGDIEVPASQSLVIEPGVVAQIDRTVAGYSVRFEVYGTLEAIGTASDSIIFTVVPGQEDPWAWYGIYLEPGTGSKKSLPTVNQNAGKIDDMIDFEQDGHPEESESTQMSRAVDVTAEDLEDPNNQDVQNAELGDATNSSYMSFCTIKYARTGVTAMHDNILIENCHILNNVDGIKWYGDERSASGELRNCLIENNTGWGIYCHAECLDDYGYANPNIENNVIKQNALGGIYLYADGDGPFVWRGSTDRAYVSPDIVGNEIYDNNGPAIKCEAAGVWTNGTPYDHWSYAYVTPKIVRNVIVNNTQVLNVTCPNYDHSQGWLSHAEIEIDHTTSWSNGDTEISAADSSEVFISNSIFWGLTSSNVQATTGASIQISYSDLTQHHPGDGNTNIDPRFVSPDNNNFALHMTSPCIDAGDPNSSKDPDSTVADMGAKYYHQSISSFSLRSPSNDTTIAILTPVLSWNTASTAGGEALEYDLYYSTDNSFPDSVTTTISANEDTTSYINEPLAEYQTYYWKVLAKNPWSMQRWSAETWHFTVNTDTIPPYFSQQLPELSFNEDESLMVPVIYWYEYIEDERCADSTLSVSIYSGINVHVASNNTFHNFTAPENWFGTDTLQIVIKDRSQLSAHGQLIISVTPINDLPVIISPDTVNAYEDLLFQYTAKAEDPEASVITYTFMKYPAWLTPVDSVISGIPPRGASDTLFLVIASDGELSDTLKVTVTVIHVNEPPQLISQNAVTAYENSLLEYTARAKDPEDSTITYTFIEYPNWLTPADSVISGIPPKGARDTSFVVIASDGELTDTLAVSVTVIITSIYNSECLVPDSYFLKHNYPNPFSQETTIEYHLPEQSKVRLSIYNLVGEHIATLVNDQQKAGIYSVNWKGKTDSDEPVAGGIYIYRIETSKFIQMRKILFMR